ncbi:MAG: DUF456 domain-containing protein [Trueperaceae bacterium]|nr:MAG: DUF456 domain-containing protein [Trueperaceae bacterium]
MDLLALLLFGGFYLLALVGLIAPLLPGVPIAAFGAILAAWITDFEDLNVRVLGLVVFLAALAQLIDLAGSYLGAKVYGASRLGLWGGVVGSLAGLLFFPPFGLLIGALVGAVVAELLVGRSPLEAVRAGFGSLVGTLGGGVAKILILVAIGVIVFPRLFTF